MGPERRAGRSGRVGVAVFLAVAVASCGDAAPPAPSLAKEWSVAPDPSVTIGGDDDRLDYVVYGVAGATRMSDGRIAVAVQSASQVRFYDASGRHLRSAGGPGDGPGEFRAIMQMRRLAGDTLLVLSRRPGLTWLAPDGAYVRSTPIDLWGLGGAVCRIGEGAWYPLVDGTLLTVLEDNFGIPGCPPTPTGVRRQSALVGRSHFATGAFDSVGIFPGTERNGRDYRVFGKSLLLALGPDELYVSDTGSDSILRLDYSGDTLGVLAVPFEPVPLPPEAKRVDVRRYRGRDGVERIGEPYDYPDLYPRIARLFLDTDGLLWVMAYPQVTEPFGSQRLAMTYAFYVESGGARWRVLDGEGRMVARVRTPDGLYPLEIGPDHVLGVSKIG